MRATGLKARDAPRFPLLTGFAATQGLTILGAMKAVLLAGGLGTRISEESHLKPKPMIEIGGRPILWHIMKMYAAHGVNDFIICLG